MPDLTVCFQVVSFICALLVLYVMQQTWHDPVSRGDSMSFRVARRVAHVLIALGLAWNISYHDTRSLPASAPEFLTVVGFTLNFLVRAIILHRHRNDRVEFIGGRIQNIIHQ